MTALVGVFGTGALRAPDALPAMLHEMRNRASLSPEIERDPGVFLAASRHAWEAELGGWNGPLLYVSDDWLIAGDATLYYLRDLRRRLDAAGRLPPDQRSGALIAAALETWGDRFARFVEGDYAFIIYDRRRRRVLLVRDSAGKRLLAWTHLPDGTLVVASSPNAVVSFPGVSAEYNLETALDPAGVELARWVQSDDPAALQGFRDKYRTNIAEDVDGDPVYLARSQFDLEWVRERNAGVRFVDVKETQRRAA